MSHSDIHIENLAVLATNIVALQHGMIKGFDVICSSEEAALFWADYLTVKRGLSVEPLQDPEPGLYILAVNLPKEGKADHALSN